MYFLSQPVFTIKKAAILSSVDDFPVFYDLFITRSPSDDLQRVSVSLGQHHRHGVGQPHGQPLPEHGQETALTVAVVAQDDTGSFRHRIQHLMVGHLTWKIRFNYTTGTNFSTKLSLTKGINW